MSSKNEERLSLVEYITYVIKVISTNKASDIISIIESFQENISIWVDEEENNKNKKMTEIFSIIKYLIVNKKMNNKNSEKNINNNNDKYNSEDEQTDNKEKNDNIIKNIIKAPFNIFPLIFSTKPKSTQKYFNIFLSIILQCICEDNKHNFSFL